MLSHASRSSRHVFLISAAVSLAVGGLGRTAAAKDCTTDLDCDTGYQCVGQYMSSTGGATSIGSGGATGSLDNGSGGAGGSVASPGGAAGYSCPDGINCATPASPPTPVDAGSGSFGLADAGALPPVPVPTPITGTCEPKPVVCMTVADCPSADFDCVVDYMPIAAPTCPANAICPTPSPPVPPGTCVAKLHACSTAADCLAPLTCQAQYTTCSGSGSVAPDGTVTMTPGTCTPGPSVCSWDPVTCTTDTGCADPLYQCVKTGGSGCSVSSGVTCAAGENCPAPDPQPCGTTVTMSCVPKLVDCACGPCPAGAACGPCATCLPGWSCFDFSIVGGVPSSWGAIASTQACLPDGIIMAAQGHATINGQFAGSSGSTGGATLVSAGDAGVPSNNGPSQVSPVPPSESPAGNAGADAGSSLQPMAHSNGCAYGGSDARSTSLWLALAMTGLVARLARRRRG